MIAKILSIGLATLLVPFTRITAAEGNDTMAGEEVRVLASSDDQSPLAVSSASADAPDPAPDREASFTGITMEDQLNQLFQSAWPPSPCLAAGPNHLLELQNQSVAVYTRAGKRLSHGRLKDFLNIQVNGVTHQATFDPKAVYDAKSGRWFAVCTASGGSQTGKGDPVILAVSKTSDPTKEWKQYLLDVGVPAAGGITYFSGNLALGVDGNGLYLGLRITPSSGNAFGKIVAIRKAPLVAASPSLGTVRQFTGLSGIVASPVPAVSLDETDATAKAWFAASMDGALANARLWSIRWSNGTPALSTALTVVTPAFAAPVDAPHKNGTALLDTGDERLQGAVLSKGHLWTCRTVGTNPSGGATSADRTGCEWLDINVAAATPVLSRSGRVRDSVPSEPRFYFFPALGVNPSGDALLSCMGVRADEFAGAWFTGREKTDAAGTMGPVQSLKAGGATYNKTVGVPGIIVNGRCGSVCLDPVDRYSLWTVQAHASSTVDSWGTWISCIGFPNPPGSVDVSKPELSFGKVPVSGNKTLNFTILSDGAHPLKVTIKPPSGPFSLVSGGGTFTLAPGAKKTVKVKFHPTAKVRKTGTIQITTNDLVQPVVKVKLVGVGK